MDVERLMKDLTVEQLENIQSNLQNEMEGKKEELREMVGRRYRDVLEASTEVRQVRTLAEGLAESIAYARTTQSIVETRRSSREEVQRVQRFIALHSLLPLIGTTEGDGLSDVFALILAENIHKQLVTENNSPAIRRVVSGLTSRLLRIRRSVLYDLRSELGELSNADWVSNQLAAISLLEDCDLDELLDAYLAARKEKMNMADDSTSVLEVASEIKDTLCVVEKLFVHGELSRVMQAIGATGYLPEVIEKMLGDGAFSFGRLMAIEGERVNKMQRERKSSTLLTAKINEKCSAWIEEVCKVVHQPVANICQFYETTEHILHFLQALNALLKENWPRVGSNSSVYQQLFRDVIIEKFKILISDEMNRLEEDLKKKLSTCNMAPQPLFEKRATKFDALLGVGISGGLRDAINCFYEGMQRMKESCNQYEKVGMEANVGQVRDSLADNLVNIINRLSSLHEDSREQSDCLSRARLCLSLLHCHSSTICQLVNKEGDRIANCSRILHAAVEDSLSVLTCGIADDCLSDSSLIEMEDICSHPLQALHIATEWEQLEVADVGHVEVPILPSPPIHRALFTLSCRLGDSCVAHLLSRGVRRRLSQQIADRLATVMEKSVAGGNAVQRTWIQLMFDAKFLYSLFPNDRLKCVISVTESHIDPFDRSLLSSHISTNIRLAVQRAQLLYSCLLVDVFSNKDAQIPQTYSQVIDILPRSEHPQRIALIPRLDRRPNEDIRKTTTTTRGNKLLTNPQTSNIKGTPSLSSFYDKISSSWFGN